MGEGDLYRRVDRRLRRGTTAVEFAIVAPILFFLLLATIIGGMGVFRYHQTAALAREGSRWASVHGGQYEKETGHPAATPEDVYNKVILPAATTLDADNLTYSVSWDQSNLPLQVIDDVQKPCGNTVTVTVSYQWFPEMFLTGPFTLTSTSTAQMIY
jgi:Flp pilus assembly protein TadG